MEKKIASIETNQPQEVPVQLPKKNNLPKIILFVILGLVIVAGAVYAGMQMGKKQISPTIIAEPTSIPTVIPQITEITPTSDETANWKTYRNTEVGYQISYPPDWELKENVNSNYLGMITISPKSATEDNMYRGSVTVWPNYSPVKAVNIQELEKNIQQAEEGVAEYSTEEFRKIGEREFWIARGGCCMDIGKHAFTLNKLSVYRITLHNLELAFTETENEIFNLILSTFKFTGQTNSTANWKTYRNTKYSFEIRYPNDWEYRESPLGGTTVDSLMVNFASAGKLPPPGTLPNIQIIITETTDKSYFSLYEETEVINTAKVADIEAAVRQHKSVDQKEVIFTKNGNTYEIISDNYSKNTLQNDIFDEILNSFKFTD